MKYKVGDNVVFTEDYRIAFGCVRKNTKGEVLGIEKIGDDDFYYSIALGDEKKKAHIPVERMDKVCVEDKTQDKHNILNGLLNSDGSIDGEKLMEKLESNSEEPEKAINLLREMKHNCEHANKYDDQKRHDKAKALGFAIELIEHDYSAVELNMEKLSNQNNDMAKGCHYEKSAMQPLEVSQVLLTKEQFEGALMFNIIKYRMRKKGQDEADAYKARQYAYWLEMVKEGRIINPSKDKVPFDYKFSII